MWKHRKAVLVLEAVRDGIVHLLCSVGCNSCWRSRLQTALGQSLLPQYSFFSAHNKNAFCSSLRQSASWNFSDLKKRGQDCKQGEQNWTRPWGGSRQKLCLFQLAIWSVGSEDDNTAAPYPEPLSDQLDKSSVGDGLQLFEFQDCNAGFEVPGTFPPSHFDSASVYIKSGEIFLFGWLQSSCMMWCSIPLRYSSPHGFKHVIQSRYKIGKREP